MSSNMCAGHKVSEVLVWVGAINWGLIGFFDFNLVNEVVGSSPSVERVIYGLIGLAALCMLACNNCSMCKGAK